MGQILLWFLYLISSPEFPVVELNGIKDFALAVLTFRQREDGHCHRDLANTQIPALDLGCSVTKRKIPQAPVFPIC